jgi:hypothetical protein
LNPTPRRVFNPDAATLNCRELQLNDPRSARAARDDAGYTKGYTINNGDILGVRDDGLTCEVTRLCTDGTYNACSLLLINVDVFGQPFRRGLDARPVSAAKASIWLY